MTLHLSPAALAVLTAVTQQQYRLDPSEVPEATGRIKYEAAAVIRAAADELDSISRFGANTGDAWDCGHNSGLDRAANKLRAIADELDLR
jgi:hypothetical protein